MYAKNSAIIMTSRVRLARNVAGARFPNAASEADLSRVFDECAAALLKIKGAKRAMIARMSDLTEFWREMLIEDRIASRELPAARTSGVFYAPKSPVSAMINEEDHLRIQAIGKGECLADLWKDLDAADDAVEKNLEYSYSEQVGYLTACPTNTGTGMRASLMMHLPVLQMSGQMEKIVRGLNQLGMVVRGADGEGSDTFGAFFQLSNQQTLGLSEDEIVEKIVKFGNKLCEFEANARAKMLEEEPLLLSDKISRALALLRSCKLIDTEESISLLSTVRLAADMGFLKGAAQLVRDIDALMIQIKPSHLCEKFRCGENIPADERDKIRAAFVNAFAAAVPEPKIK